MAQGRHGVLMRASPHGHMHDRGERAREQGQSGDAPPRAHARGFKSPRFPFSDLVRCVHLPFSNFDMVVAAAMVAFCVPAAFCLRPSSSRARHVPQATVTAQAGNALGLAALGLATAHSADVRTTSVHTSRSLVSMLDTPVLDQLGSQLSMDTGMDTAGSPLLERLEAMEVGACQSRTRKYNMSARTCTPLRHSAPRNARIVRRARSSTGSRTRLTPPIRRAGLLVLGRLLRPAWQGVGAGLTQTRTLP